MSRKRNNLSQSISSLAASIPDLTTNHVPAEFVEEQSKIAETTVDVVTTSEPDNGKENPFSDPPKVTTPENPLDLFTKWSLTPEGHRVRDNRIPADPVRLGCILDDNARIAFLAGYAAATPSFE